jgi:hypothetical protein
LFNFPKRRAISRMFWEIGNSCMAIAQRISTEG